MNGFPLSSEQLYCGDLNNRTELITSCHNLFIQNKNTLNLNPNFSILSLFFLEQSYRTLFMIYNDIKI